MKLIAWFLFFVSILIFGSVLIRPIDIPYIGLLPFLVPVFWLLNFFLFIILALAWKKTSLIPLMALLIGYQFVPMTFQWNPKKTEEGLQVLSYNVHLFDYKKRLGGTFDPNIYSWLQKHPAEIKVFQEFFQDQTAISRDAVRILGKDNDRNLYYEIIGGSAKKRSFGLAISSTYPILNRGKVFDTSNSNGAIFADIRYQGDTIRVYNCHLESMKIDTQGFDNLDEVKGIYKETLRKLHQGALQRSKQLSVLEAHIRSSPHPLILMGDLNEIPYSNTYFRLSDGLQNAFEKGGRGFGFTFNRILFFLRIDHIFASPEWKVLDFQTHREVDYSDHYPISATLKLHP